MKNKTTIIACLLCGLVFGVGGFYGGMKYQQSKVSSRGGFMMQGNFNGQKQGAGTNLRGANGNAGAGMANGEIIAKDEKSITVKLRDGGSKIIFYSTSTQVKKIIDGAAADLEIGKQATISGTSNQDGSITAQAIQMRSAEQN